MIDLNRIQEQAREWRALNFPHHTLEDQLIGMTEELGELAHAILKHKQGIRGMDDQIKYEAAVMDALGDLFLFACGVADKLGIRMTIAIANAWAEVQDRDWVSNPGQLTIDEP